MPKPAKFFAVPCHEWDFLKENLAKVGDGPWFLPAISSAFLGAAVAQIATILSGGVAPRADGTGLIIAWAIFSGALGIGLACVFGAIMQHRAYRAHVGGILRQMALMESRWEEEGAARATSEKAEASYKDMTRTHLDEALRVARENGEAVGKQMAERLRLARLRAEAQRDKPNP